jgi:hypothetical protein
MRIEVGSVDEPSRRVRSRAEGRRQASLDQPLPLQQQQRRDRDPQQRGALAVDHEVDAGRLLDRQIAGPCALADLVDED